MLYGNQTCRLTAYCDFRLFLDQKRIKIALKSDVHHRLDCIHVSLAHTYLFDNLDSDCVTTNLRRAQSYADLVKTCP